MTGAVAAQIARALAHIAPEVLLPQGRAGQNTQLTRPLSLLAAVEISPPTAMVPAAACLVADGTSGWIAAPLLLDGGRLRRAAPGDGASADLVRMLATRGPGPVPAGIELVTFGSPYPRAPSAGGFAGSLLETAITVDQTHDSVVVGSGGDAVVVKWAVHAGAAPSPAAAAAPEPAAVAAVRHLHGAGFTEMPEPYGFLLATVDGTKVLLASVARYLPAAKDGWDWYVDDLQALVAHRSSIQTALAPASAIGAVVARMHLAFARPDPADPADCGGVAPVTTADPGSFQAWARRGISTLDEAVAVTVGPAGQRLRARQPAAREVMAALGRHEPATTLLTRIHGDLHVGQVLRWPGGYAVSDFDGNPILAAFERSAPAPPARDVAGMLRALDHVGRIVMRRHDGAADDVVQRWIPAARRAFLDAYTAELARAQASQLFDRRLLPAFEVEQECRELVYAARHLPRWTYVPDAALGALLDCLAAEPATAGAAARPAPPPGAPTVKGT